MCTRRSMGQRYTSSENAPFNNRTPGTGEYFAGLTLVSEPLKRLRTPSMSIAPSARKQFCEILSRHANRYDAGMARAWVDQSLLDRMVTAVERVRERLRRATAALEAAGVPYAVVGGNAVAAWVATIDPAAIRNTQDVDILLRRGDLDAAEQALSAAGFVRCQVAGVEMFLDGPAAGPRDAVHILIAGEKIRPEYLTPAPDVSEAVKPEDFQVIALETLVRMKLTSYRDKDKTHLRDMLEVGLIDPTWTARLPTDLAARLQLLIDTPQG